MYPWHSAPANLIPSCPLVYLLRQGNFSFLTLKILLLSPSYCFWTKRKGKGQHIWGNNMTLLEITAWCLFSYLKAETEVLSHFPPKQLYFKPMLRRKVAEQRKLVFSKGADFHRSYRFPIVGIWKWVIMFLQNSILCTRHAGLHKNVFKK